MQATLYDETIPVFIRFFKNLDALLRKTARFAGDSRNKTNEKKLIASRLSPDMYTFKEQIGYAYFMALECATKLSGKPSPQFGYDETSIKELRESVKRVMAFLESIRRADFKHSEGKRVMTYLAEGRAYSREQYVRQLAMPNFFFHVTTAYGILRSKGVPLGKKDFLG